jgi:hypothetical protein
MPHFIKAYFILIIPIFFLSAIIIFKSGIEMGLMGYIIIPLVINFIPSTLIVMFADKMGSFAGKLYTGGNPQSPSEIYMGLLDQARYLKSKNQYDEALKAVDEYIENVPGNPEALFIRGQILWEGFKDGQSAKQCLLDIIKSTDKEDRWHQWAVTSLRDITTP